MVETFNYESNFLTTGSGNTTSGSVFGQQQSQQTSTFGSVAAAAPSSGGQTSVFGSANQASSNTSVFGNPAPNATPFGGSQPATQQPQSTGAFGTPVSQTFGGQQSTSIFGGMNIQRLNLIDNVRKFLGML